MARPKTPVIRIKKLHEHAELPQLATSGASGFDLVAAERVQIPSGERSIVGTGIAVAIPSGYEGQVRPRSGLAARYGLTVLNTPGTIDSDYRGEVMVIMHNTGPDYHIKKGDRIAQLVIQKVPKVKFEVVEELDETDRGDGGLGSTGK